MSKESRLNGLVAGAMIGDCLGIPYVFMKSDQILQNAAQACWKTDMPGATSGLLMTALSAVKRYGFVPQIMATRYQKWAKHTPLELDLITSRCFAQKKKLSLNELYTATEISDHGALCSAMLLIRQIPIVIAHTNASVAELFQYVQAECRLSHSDPVSIECAQLFALCLQNILNGKSRIQNWNCLFQAIHSSEVYRIVMNSYYAKPVCDNHHYSHASTALGLALYHYWHDTPFVSAIRSAVLAGGLTDVNAAVTGALIGASQGFKSIPHAWIEAALQPVTDKSTPSLSVMLKHANIIAIHAGYLPMCCPSKKRPRKQSDFSLLAA